MVVVDIEDWSEVVAAFEAFFAPHGGIAASAQEVRFRGERVATGVTIQRAGTVRAYMPLHEVEIDARRLAFDEVRGELRVDSASGHYLYRRP